MWKAVSADSSCKNTRLKENERSSLVFNDNVWPCFNTLVMDSSEAKVLLFSVMLKALEPGLVHRLKCGEVLQLIVVVMVTQSAFII